MAGYKIRKSRQEIDRLSKQNEQLQNEKAVAQTQVQHFETRKKNEENNRTSNRNGLIDRLQQQGDLRD
ncbi:PF10883 family protein [Pasteurella bettyae CCUG 2042]|uniref:PF10883 family protein n=2 Tax=Pasteurella bettyae TaxID=752 RepID=I3D8V4_9PAST|nr:PF10883 family protein [Pasteurella bettyae CCUG 2042]